MPCLKVKGSRKEKTTATLGELHTCIFRRKPRQRSESDELLEKLPLGYSDEPSTVYKRWHILSPASMNSHLPLPLPLPLPLSPAPHPPHFPPPPPPPRDHRKNPFHSLTHTQSNPIQSTPIPSHRPAPPPLLLFLLLTTPKTTRTRIPPPTFLPQSAPSASAFDRRRVKIFGEREDKIAAGISMFGCVEYVAVGMD